MGRRSGLKNAHFSSVPTRMNLFTCKKYVFLIEKNFPNLTTPPKNRKNSIQRFPMGRVVEWELVLQRICRNSDRFILRSNTCGVGDGWERDLSLEKRFAEFKRDLELL